MLAALVRMDFDLSSIADLSESYNISDTRIGESAEQSCKLPIYQLPWMTGKSEQRLDFGNRCSAIFSKFAECSFLCQKHSVANVISNMNVVHADICDDELVSKTLSDVQLRLFDVQAPRYRTIQLRPENPSTTCNTCVEAVHLMSLT